jgi:hypothetical protein
MPENVTPLWPQLVALFRPALAMVSTHTAEDLRRAIMAMRAQLWVQMVNEVVTSAVVTEFVEYPAGLHVRVWLAGAEPTREMDKTAFVETLDRWRIAHNCVAFEAIGRHGWLRIFPWLKVEGMVMRGVP